MLKQSQNSLANCLRKIPGSRKLLKKQNELNCFHYICYYILFLCRLDVIINSPIIVLPVSNDSKEVFIASLGKICCRNDVDESLENMRQDVIVKYLIEVTNINLFSLNINEQNEDWAFTFPIASRMYANKQKAFPILHDTAISLKLNLGYGDANVEERKIQTLSVSKHKKLIYVHVKINLISSLGRRKHGRNFKSNTLSKAI